MHKSFGLLSGLAAASIWGGMYVVSKAVMAVIPPFTLITLRLALGILVLFGIQLVRRIRKIHLTWTPASPDARDNQLDWSLASPDTEDNQLDRRPASPDTGDNQLGRCPASLEAGNNQLSRCPVSPDTRNNQLGRCPVSPDARDNQLGWSPASPDAGSRENIFGTTRTQFWQVFSVGFVGYGISIGFQFVGTKMSTAANGSLVTSATPAFVLLFATILLRERITPRRLLALLVASLGVLVVIDPRTAQLSPSLFWGNLSLVAAALTWALYSVLIRKVTQDIDVLSTSLIAFLGGLPVSIPIGVWEISTQVIGPIGWGVVAGILFLGIISTALAMYLWNTAFANLEAGVASLTFFAQPVVGTILGAVFLGDKITTLFILGGVLIGIGLLIASRE